MRDDIICKKKVNFIPKNLSRSTRMNIFFSTKTTPTVNMQKVYYGKLPHSVKRAWSPVETLYGGAHLNENGECKERSFS